MAVENTANIQSDCKMSLQKFKGVRGDKYKTNCNTMRVRKRRINVLKSKEIGKVKGKSHKRM